MFKNCYFNLRSLIDFNGFFKTTASYLNKSATNNLHCFRNLRSKGFRTKSKKQDLVFSVKLRYLGLEKLPKKWLSENVQILWGPKQAIMVQKWPFLKPKSKLKSNIHQKLWNKKIFIFMNCTKKSKENKEF